MIMNYKEHKPQIAESAYIAPTAAVIGQVELGEEVSVWFGTVVRGDNQPICIGEGTNVQDNSTLHCNRYDPLTVGKRVTIGHNVVLHSCTIGDNCLIGMGAVVMDNAVIGENSIVAAGALVTPGKNFPPNSLVIGSPAYVKGEVSAEALESAQKSTEEYILKTRAYKAMTE